MPKKTLAVIGVGMMGGSVGLAVKKRKLPWRVLGLGRNLSRLKNAKKIGACDEISVDLAAVREADLVILCTAVSQIVPTFQKIAPHLKADAVVSDIGSVKSGMADGISDARFIGGHPLAGSEKTGAENSRADLYHNATVALCPSEGSSKNSLKLLTQFWKSIGALPLILKPDIHDILVAQTSHLPHVISSAFAQLITNLNHKDKRTAKLLAGSFRDTTRIVDSDSKQWAEISTANQKFLIGAIKSYRDMLLRLVNKIEASKSPEAEWESFFAQARAGRKKLL